MFEEKLLLLQGCCEDPNANAGQLEQCSPESISCVVLDGCIFNTVAVRCSLSLHSSQDGRTQPNEAAQAMGSVIDFLP